MTDQKRGTGREPLVPAHRVAVSRSFEDIAAGEEASFSLEVTPALVDAFVEVSGDASPIHVDAEAARARGFQDRVAHGALLVGLVSGILGTRLPGPGGVLHSIQMKFKRPCCIGERITVSVRVGEKIPSVETLLLEATVRDADGALVAQGKCQSGVLGSRDERDGKA